MFLLVRLRKDDDFFVDTSQTSLLQSLVPIGPVVSDDLIAIYFFHYEGNNL